MPNVVVGDFSREPFHKFRTLGPRTHQGHIALEDAPQLRYFVEPSIAKEFADVCDARIVVGCPGRPVVSLSIRAHRSKLVAKENIAIPANPFLSVEYRSRRVKPNRQHDEGNQWQSHNESHEGCRHIQQSPQQAEGRPESKTSRENDPAWIQMI